MKRILILALVLMLVGAGVVLAKQWDQYTDLTAAPDSADTVLIYDTTATEDSEKVKEITISYLMQAYQLAPVYVDMAGLTTYTIDLSLGNTFLINTVGSKGTTGCTIYPPNLTAGTSQYANRPYRIVNNTISGTTPLWITPQYETSQCTQWVIANAGVTTGQSGVSYIAHATMDARMDSITILPRYVSATGGASHYVIDETIH